MLQRLIDSARSTPAGQATRPAAVRRDSAKRIIAVSRMQDTLTNGPQDSSSVPGSLLNTANDSATTIAIPVIQKPLTWGLDTAFVNLLKIPYIKKTIQPLLRDGELRLPLNNDYLFYVLTGVVLLLAIIKQLFPKYFINLFRLMFEASFRQKQRREQLMQETLPSLLMNILFIIVGGLFIALLAGYYGWLKVSFWWLAMYSITVLALIYSFKYIVIQFTGWVFNAREQASTYSFIVFLINKIIGVALLPLLLLLAFSKGYVWDVAVTIAAAIIGFLLIFRYIISLRIIRGTLSINPLHFFIYLCAVELLPMLIIYRVLINLTGNSN